MIDSGLLQSRKIYFFETQDNLLLAILFQNKSKEQIPTQMTQNTYCHSTNEKWRKGNSEETPEQSKAEKEENDEVFAEGGQYWMGSWEW